MGVYLLREVKGRLVWSGVRNWAQLDSFGCSDAVEVCANPQAACLCPATGD